MTIANIQKIRCHQTFNMRIKVQKLSLLSLFTIFTSKSNKNNGEKNRKFRKKIISEIFFKQKTPWITFKTDLHVQKLRVTMLIKSVRKTCEYSGFSEREITLTLNV